ncbi:type II toxin-antitoxin system RelE/ParE family toxin [Geotalea toluenoxydans]|uniref:type II toxin-antitoxin system RelE/ParE family toxin n=1 Tax=Geotalea toluenoxydans TaxID=421624 RepID=UPI0006D2189D|nr:type II toxin-antitoxin system RelE/ParE family toxin [Geotalea toluenoxydans]
MLKILKSPAAENDLDEIWWYIAQDNPDSADKLLDEIEEASRKLCRFSDMGRNRDELHSGLKSFPVGMYLIFYMPISGGIHIVRVLHGMMDIDAFF